MFKVRIAIVPYVSFNTYLTCIVLHTTCVNGIYSFQQKIIFQLNHQIAPFLVSQFTNTGQVANMRKNLLLVISGLLFLSTLYILYLNPTNPSLFLFPQPMQHLHAVCAAEGRRDPAVKPPNLLHWSVEPESKLLMCRTAKHGSTSWANIFVRIYTQGFAGDLDQIGF